MRRLIKRLAKLAQEPGKARPLLPARKFSVTTDLSRGPRLPTSAESPSSWHDVKSGRVAFAGDRVLVYATREGVWGPLQPLVDYPGTQEVFIRGSEVEATVSDRRYRVELPVELDAERLIQRLAILSNVRLSEAEPQAEAEYGGWRLYFKMPLVSGRWEVTATRIVAIPRLSELVSPLLAARLVALVMRPSVAVVMGPSGSGKTTLLNSLLNEVLRLWPHLRVSIVEQVRELVLPERGNIARSVARPGTPVTLLIRQSLRYERPELFVLGELRGEEVWSWVEAGRLGIATLTTIHAPSLEKGVETMAQLMRQGIPGASVKDVLRLIDIFVLTRKYLMRGAIARRVEAVAVSIFRHERCILQPIYVAGRGHLEEGEFLELLPERLMVGEAGEVYSKLLEFFHVDVSEPEFAELEPLELE